MFQKQLFCYQCYLISTLMMEKNIYKNVNIVKFNSFLTKVSENCYYKLNFYALLQCLGVSILTILSVIHCWNPPVSGMYCFRIMFV